MLQVTPRTQESAHLTASSWLAFPDGPAFAVDAGFLVARSGSQASPYFRAGGGFLVHRELKGPGIHLGVGLLVPPGVEPGIRLEGMFHRYTPDDGVPVLSLTVTLLNRMGSARTGTQR